ncbi:MAG TPA: hypothetical protein VMG10_36930 [Gemmataceae bacterium]|nr:hypothetical protein [Gemmataceae bacterium]
MMGKRFVLTATLATLLASVGCLRNMCERHGYYPVTPPPPAYAPQCCVPCCPGAPAAGYAAATPAWNAPAPPPPAATCPSGCVVPPHN